MDFLAIFDPRVFRIYRAGLYEAVTLKSFLFFPFKWKRKSISIIFPYKISLSYWYDVSRMIKIYLCAFVTSPVVLILFDNAELQSVFTPYTFLIYDGIFSDDIELETTLEV